MTSDHGVMPIPEHLKALGADAGRIPVADFKAAIDAELDKKIGPADWISSFEPPNLYLNLDAVDRSGRSLSQVESLCAGAAGSVTGVGEVFCAYQLASNQLPSSAYAEQVRRSYYGPRSGELFLLTRPGYIFSSEPLGTTHGSAYSYDTHVPLIMAGAAIK